MATAPKALKDRAKELKLDVGRRDGSDGEPTREDYEYAIGVAEGALVPDEELRVATEQEYVVTGPQEVDGHAPGEKFTATLDLERREFLIATGHLEPVQDQATNDQDEEA